MNEAQQRVYAYQYEIQQATRGAYSLFKMRGKYSYIMAIDFIAGALDCTIDDAIAIFDNYLKNKRCTI